MAHLSTIITYPLFFVPLKKLKTKIFVTIFLCCHLGFSENEFAKYYQINDNCRNVLISDSILPFRIIYNPSDMNGTMENLLAEGYVVLGESKFFGNLNDEEDIPKLAKDINSSIAIIYMGQRGVENWHNIWVLFLALTNQTNRFGTSLQPIPKEYTKMFEKNSGAYVSRIIKNSLAFKNGVILDDIILSINKEDAFPETANAILTDCIVSHKDINLKIFRNASEIELLIKP
jgi:hypothetical protein